MHESNFATSPTSIASKLSLSLSLSTHDVALELQLGLETIVQKFAVLTTPRIVVEVVRTHHRSDSGLNGT